MKNNKNGQVLIGCGILKKEINLLVQKNNWDINSFFLDSLLHIDFDKLYRSLTKAIEKHTGKDVFVFYGACHPLMDNIIQNANTIRTEGQNCVEILLGNELFTKELSNGAFFLLEDWATRWEYINFKTFGNNKEIIRQIFQEDRKYVLGVKTPCSGDFTKDAEQYAQFVGLPLKWIDVNLNHLETALFPLITN